MNNYSYEPIVLSEKCEDLRALHYLASLKFEDFEEYYKNSRHSDDSLKDKKENFIYMQKWANELIKNNGIVKRTYKISATSNPEVEGRLYSGASVQGKFYKVRGLTFHHTTDIDMKNAHPVLLKYICDLHGISCPKLTDYVENRDIWMAEIMEETGLSRNEVKTKILKATNKSAVDKRLKGKLYQYDKELKAVQKAVLAVPEYQKFVSAVPKDKTYNKVGSAINRLLCYYENRVLQIVKKVVENNGFEVASLMFDGLMIYGNEYKNTQLLKDVETAIEEVYPGMNMKMDYKEHDTSIQIPDDFEIPEVEVEVKVKKPKKPTTIDEDKMYEVVKARFEENFCLVRECSAFFNVLPDRVISYKKENLITSYSNIKYQDFDKNGQIKDFDFIKKWVTDEHIRAYDRVGVYPPPLECPENVLNTWLPFQMELVEEYEEKPEELEIVLNHMRVLCNNDENVFDYFCKWIGQMIEYPAVKTNMPVFISEEGAGKGTLTTLMAGMLGEYKLHETTEPSRDCWGSFNETMNTTFFVILNELDKKETMGAEGKIKGLITDGRLTINGKGKGQYPITSYHRWMTNTNVSDGGIKTHENDRRKWVVRCSDEKIGDLAYFRKLNKVVRDPDVLKTCFEYFRSLPDLDMFHYIQKPKTEYHEEICELHEDRLETFIKYEAKRRDGIETFYGKEIYQQFKAWKTETDTKYEIDFQRFLYKMKVKKYMTVFDKKNKTNIYMIDWNDVRSKYKLQKEEYDLPSEEED